MLIVKTTDDKYLGTELPGDVKVGDIVKLGLFDLEVQYIRVLANENIVLGSPNYQIQCEE